MSNEIADIREQIKREISTARDTVPAPSGRSISTRGKMFHMPDGTQHRGPMKAVILDWRNYNRYYTQAFDPQNPVPPMCFAIDSVIHNMAPHEEAKEPQSETCASCAHNKWGSAPQGKGKACRNTVRIAIVPPESDENSEPMLLNISPTGLKGWAAYVNDLTSREMHPLMVVTEIALDADKPYPTLLFSAQSAHSDSEQAMVTAARLRHKAQILLDAPPTSGE